MRTLRVPGADALHERDFYAWTLAQAAELRRMAQARSNSALDLSNLIDEVAGLGRTEKRTVRSHVETVIEHLLKLDHSPALDPRLGWMETIDRTRAALEDALTATLRRDVERHLGLLYGRARRVVARSVARHGEHEAARNLPPDCPYSLDDVLRDGWYSTAAAPDLDA